MLVEYGPQPDKCNRKPNVYTTDQAGGASAPPTNTPSMDQERWTSPNDRSYRRTANGEEQECCLGRTMPSSACSRGVANLEGTTKREERDDADCQTFVGSGGDGCTLNGQMKVIDNDINESHIESGGHGSGIGYRTSSDRATETVSDENLHPDSKCGAINADVEDSGANDPTEEDPGVVPSQSSKSGAGCQATFPTEEAGQKGNTYLSDALESGEGSPSLSPSPSRNPCAVCSKEGQRKVR